MAERHGETAELPVEALLEPDFELWLVNAPLVETESGCRFEACESEEACTCEDSGGTA